jgi:hypothetical protein
MDDFTKVVILENESEAQFMASILEERGVPHRIRSYYDSSFDGLFQSQKGWGMISAPDAFHGEILDIISTLRHEPFDQGEMEDETE